jgi:hypothetical protein
MDTLRDRLVMDMVSDIGIPVRWDPAGVGDAKNILTQDTQRLTINYGNTGTDAEEL